MNKYHINPITLTGDDINIKRQEILIYFKTGFELFESLFDMLKDEGVFYKKSELTRHPMIFYYGHTATFFINKLILSGIIKTRIDQRLESLFAIGVDEMSWDQLDESKYDWPTVQEVKNYRVKVKKLVEELIKTIPLNLPISQDDPMWVILMGCEHERIHIETSSVLHRQMPIENITKLDTFPICKVDSKFKKNEMMNIPKRDIRLGKDQDHHLYGWDNEYGEYNCTVEKFEVSKFLVSNGEYLEFVQDNGYEELSYWDDEGVEFLKRTNAKHPPFWISDKGGFYKLRTLMETIELPLSHPVEVCCLEAQAFCRWKTKKEGLSYTLPSEEQYYSIYEDANLKDIPTFDDRDANINLSHYASTTPVDMFKFNNGIYDVVGNVWQHTITPIYPYSGFKVHTIYDDFSVPTFDNLHNLIKGGSFISTGNEMMKYSRYAFRRHFYQHAGFRYIKGDKQIDIKSFDDSDHFINDQLELHYNSQDIIELYNFIEKLIKDQNYQNTLQIGCSVGAGSFKLALHTQKLYATDTTARVIQEAQKHKRNHTVGSNIEFLQLDPCNMKPNFTGYDLIVLDDIFNRVYSVSMMLDSIHTRLQKSGNLIVISKKDQDVSSLHKEFKIIDSTEVLDKVVSRWEKS